MTQLASVRSAFKAAFAGALASAIVMIAATAPRADEGGVSFWVPGFFGSLAATPLVPGFSYANIYYHTSVNAGGDVAFARQVNRGNITANFSGNLNATINADVDLYMAVPSYTFAQPFLGGQATVLASDSLTAAPRRSVDATLTGNLGLGGPGFTISGGRTDEILGFGDVAGMFNVRWNAGVHNYHGLRRHELHDRPLRPDAARQSRARTQCDRRRRRLHLFRHEDRRSSSRRCSVSRTISRIAYVLPERRQHAPGRRDVAVRDQGKLQARTGRLCLQADSHATPERATGLAASRPKFSVSDHRSATSFRSAPPSGLSQPEGLQGIRGRASRIRLECLVDIRNLTRPAEGDAIKGTAHDTTVICDDSRTVRLSCPVWVLVV